ncbi:VOC family protein [Naumannella halotolerans]|uniref:PhnB protein n=1 Tax=Naumannella halotolerans TaxID=993414 RepID=A0A4V3EN85_9ACTN|nr:VOC family protein [Naumannella halotolerans]TDT32748.1 PhnB protein [Naumannella halotolerans]
MVTRLNPYLNFRDEARQALEFYHEGLGGTLDILSFGASGMADDPAVAELVMHGAVVSEIGLTLYAADTPPGMASSRMGNAISVALTSDQEDLRPYWDRLTQGAEIQMPFEIAPWGDRYGAFVDRFGVPWMFDQPGDA